MNRERYLQEIDAVNAAGKYHPTWESLSTHLCRTGIGRSGWASSCTGACFLFRHIMTGTRGTCTSRVRRNTSTTASITGSEGFRLQGFHSAIQDGAFDPQAWVKLFREAGADYIVPVAEHHDGFQNYRSDLSHWNAAEMGPHRDIMGDLLVEAERAGMTLGASSHRVEHWWFLGHGQEFDSDIKQPMYLGDYAWPAMPERENQDLFSEPMPTDEFLTDWLLRCCEIVDRYHPRILYFDWWIQHSAVKPYLQRFAAYYFT